jgi:hypothetical protein
VIGNGIGMTRPRGHEEEWNDVMGCISRESSDFTPSTNPISQIRLMTIRHRAHLSPRPDPIQAQPHSPSLEAIANHLIKSSSACSTLISSPLDQLSPLRTLALSLAPLETLNLLARSARTTILARSLRSRARNDIPFSPDLTQPSFSILTFSFQSTISKHFDTLGVFCH